MGRRFPGCVTKWTDSNRHPSPVAAFNASSIVRSQTSASSTTLQGAFPVGGTDTASAREGAGRFLGGVGDDQVGASPLDRNEDLHRDAVPVDPP